MFDIGILQIEQWVSDFLWPFFRIASFMMVVPLFGSNLVMPRARLGLSITLSILIVPNLPVMPKFNGLEIESYLIIGQQMLVGITLGFIMQMLFQVFILGGQLIASQMGLGFASSTDPVNGVNVVILGQLYLTMIMLLFVIMDGHLVLIDVLVRSFELIPIGFSGFSSDIFWRVASSGTWLFSAALLVSLPAVTALLVVNFAFGIMTRAAPQLNIFAIGFPFTMLLGLFIVWASLQGFFDQYLKISTFVLDFLASTLVM